MTDDDEKLGDWGSKLDDKNAPAIGVNKDMLRKALALNPNLRQGQSSNDMMALIQQGHREKSSSRAGGRQTGTPAKLRRYRHRSEARAQRRAGSFEK